MDLDLLVQKVHRMQPKRRAVLALVVDGKSNREIAGELGYRESSIRSIVGEIYKYLGVGKAKVKSRTRKHRLAADAYRQYQREVGEEDKPPASPWSEGIFTHLHNPSHIDDVRMIPLGAKSNASLARLHSRGYRPEAVFTYPNETAARTVMVKRRA